MLQSILRRAAQVSAKNAKVAAARPLVASRAASSKVNHDSPDDAFTATRYPAGDAESKRAFTYFVLGSARFLYASAARVIVIRALAHMSASADVLALASLEVDLAKVNPGTTITVKWRGKPVFIRNRTEEQIAKAVAVPMSDLKDPEPDADRAIDPQWLVVMGVCTHLGCVPISDAGDYLGWYCPCHGSHYDGAGRIRKGPAPLNLEVPPYKFLSDGKLMLG